MRMDPDTLQVPITLYPRKVYSLCLGVVSWGIGCGGYYHPGVYTEVSYFVDWIAANMA